MNDIEKKRSKEKATVEFMIRLYCRKNHGSSLCPECTELLDYALQRTERCPHMKTKTFCSRCKTHCYKPEMREKIRTVMRFSGPRMMLYRPLDAIRHKITE